MIMRTVGLFGFYERGNFGDDLMALLFGEVLRKRGWRVLVYPCRPELAEEAGLETARDAGELVRETDCIVYGGGGILVPHQMKAGSHYSQFRRELLEVVEAAERCGRPIAAISIGGTGRIHDALPEPVRRLLDSPCLSCLTLRLEGDRAWFHGSERVPDVFPDVVLQTGTILPRPRCGELRDRRKYVIGLNLGCRRADRLLLGFLKICQRIFGGIEIRSLGTFVSDSAVRVPELSGGRGTSRVDYERLHPFLEQLAEFDLVFTHKLHIGVAALSFGVPAISWNGAAKARSFFREAGMKGAVVGGSLREISRFFLEMLAARGRCPRWRRPRPKMLEGAVRESARHFEALDGWLSQVADRRADRSREKREKECAHEAR